jgi:predicted dehydrogenase
VVALAATSQDNSDAAAAAHGVPVAYGDYREMVAADDIDLICVTTNMMTHHELVMRALAAGKNVFCEWPLAPSTALATEMRDEAERQGVRTLVGLQNRLAPEVAYVRDLIAQGYVGDGMSVSMRRANEQMSQLALPESYLYIVDRERGNAGLTILGGHSVDILDAYVGPLVDLQAYAEVMLPTVTVEGSGTKYDVTAPDHILVQGRLANGAVVSSHLTVTSRMDKPFHLEISGSQGLLAITSDERLPAVERQPGIPSRLRIYGVPRFDADFEDLPVPPEYRRVPSGTPLGQPHNVAYMYQMYADAVRAGRRNELDFDHAVRLHHVLDRVSEAAEAGSRVTVS